MSLATAFALALMVVAVPEMVRASAACVGDCRELGHVTAADLVLMNQIAVGRRAVSECSAGGAGDDSRITPDDIDQAVRGIFGACSEGPSTYGALAGDIYQIAYPTRLVSLTQAAALVAALEAMGGTDEAALRALLPPLLGELGVDAARIEQIVIVAQREAADCEDCIATCSGRCVQSPRGDCFCYERLPTDPARGIAILFLERPEDELMAFDADRVPCKDALLSAGVHDSFSTANGIEATTQSAGLLSLIQAAAQTPANFDQTSIDRLFGQSFTLPQGKCLVAAKVLLRARPIASSIAPGSRNDVLRLGFVSPAGQFVGAVWAAYFGSGNTGLPSLLNQQWAASNFPAPGAAFVLDLANLPGGTNLLPALDAQRFLDVYMQDDSSIDYVDLVYRLCDCPLPTPTPTHVPTRTLTPTKTPTRTVTPTVIATTTRTPRPTATRTRTAAATATRTITATPIPTRTATPVGTTTCVPPPTNMVAWWPLDEAAGSTSVIDIAPPPSNHGIPKPGPIQMLPPNAVGPATVAGNLVTGPADGALYFYTPATYVEVPHSSDLDLANSDLTIDAWVKPLPGPWSAGRDSLHIYTIIDKLDPAANTGYAFFLKVQTSCPTCPPPPQQPPPSGAASTMEFRFAFAVGSGSALTIYTSAPFYSGTGTVFPSPTPPSLLTPQPPGWTHAAVTLDRSQNIGKFHLNGGHLSGSDFVPIAGLNNTSPLWIGGTRLYGTPQAPNFVEFTLNEIEVFRVAVAQADLQAIASAPAGKCKPTPVPTATPTVTPTRPPECVRPPPNMIAWWTADNTTTDFSGNGYHGAFFQPPGMYTAGIVGAAFSLPTIPDFVQASSSLNFSGNFSLDAWIRTTNTGLAAVIDKRLNAGFNPIGYYLFVLGGSLGFELGDGQPSLAHVSAGPFISDGNWHHVAATIDRASTAGGHLYVDGALVHTFDPTTRPGSIANGFFLRIGQAYISAIGFKGAIDEVELFDRALLAQEVQDIFQARSAGKCKTPRPTRTGAPTSTPTRTRTSAAMPTPTNTLAPLATATDTPIPAPTPTRTLVSTPTASFTATHTRTPTATSAPSVTPTTSLTATHTRTPTVTSAPSVTPTAGGCPGAICTPTPTRTATLTPTPQCFGELCVFKFEDQDGDGVRDPSEPGLAGWTIHATDPNMNVVTATTGPQGSICTGVPAPLAYTISEVLQSGWTQTFPPPPGTHPVFIECGQLLNVQFGNVHGAIPTPTRTATLTPTTTATRTRTRTARVPPPD